MNATILIDPVLTCGICRMKVDLLGFLFIRAHTMPVIQLKCK